MTGSLIYGIAEQISASYATKQAEIDSITQQMRADEAQEQYYNRLCQSCYEQVEVLLNTPEVIHILDQLKALIKAHERAIGYNEAFDIALECLKEGLSNKESKCITY